VSGKNRRFLKIWGNIMPTIANNSKNAIQVSVNEWGDEGGISTDWFEMKPGESDSWHRTDSRGYVMAVNQGGYVTPYYILPDSEISIFDFYVQDGENQITAATNNNSD
jgi:hypothetical protein